MEDARHYGIMSNLQSHKLFFFHLLSIVQCWLVCHAHIFLGIILMHMVFHIRDSTLSMLPVGASRLSENGKFALRLSALLVCSNKHELRFDCLFAPWRNWLSQTSLHLPIDLPRPVGSASSQAGRH